MSSSSDTDDDIPEAKVCQQLVEEFASITQTDTACAQFYLQDRSWNLQVSALLYPAATLSTVCSSIIAFRDVVTGAFNCSATFDIFSEICE